MSDIPKPFPRTRIRQPLVELSEVQRKERSYSPRTTISVGQGSYQNSNSVSIEHSEVLNYTNTAIEIHSGVDPEAIPINDHGNCDDRTKNNNDQISEHKTYKTSVSESTYSDGTNDNGNFNEQKRNFGFMNGEESDEDEILKYTNEDYGRKLEEDAGYTNTSSNGSGNSSKITELTEHEIQSNDNLLGIQIHRTDCLKMSRVIQHPSVIVHIVDLKTNGAYLRKQTPDKNVTYNQEKSNFILPIMTRPYDFKKKKSIIPEWEEILAFNENTSKIIKPSTIFFFEIVDFIDASNSPDAEYASIGWHRIAWAFLKPIGAKNARKIDQLFRLQLYKSKIKSTSINNSNIPEVHLWYQEKKWKKYPSTIYVTVREVSSGTVNAQPQQRSCTPFQPEIGSDTSVKSLAILSDESSDSKTSLNVNTIQRLGNIEWNRVAGQSCQIPNSKIATLHPDPKGCLAIKFSNSGLFLACGASFNVFIFAIDGVLERTLVSHQGLIYTLSWFTDDSYLLSASGDCTACIWDMKSASENPVQILPHPSFVYCSTFLYPERTVVTGCYDGIIRIWWHTHNTSKNWQLHQELSGHEEYVSAITYFKNKQFFSGDVRGLIIQWAADEYGSWFKLNVIKLTEIQGTVINKLVVFPGQKRLLIHTRDSLLRTIDIKTRVIIQWYQGGLNDTHQCNCVVTPCGSLVFANSEDGTVNVWESNTGKHVAFYSGGIIGSNGGGSMDYHAYDHICAFSCFLTTNTPLAVHLLKYSTNQIHSDIGMYILNEPINLIDDSYSSSSCDNRNSKTFDQEDRKNYKPNKTKDQEKSKIKLRQINVY